MRVPTHHAAQRLGNIEAAWKLPQQMKYRIINMRLSNDKALDTRLLLYLQFKWLQVPMPFQLDQLRPRGSRKLDL